MSDDPNDLNDENGEPLNPAIREQLRSQERELKEANKRLRAAELRAVYSELGIPDSGAGKLFRDTYPGDATLDAVRTAAESYGDAVLPKVVDQRQDELDALRRLNSASDGTQSPEAQDILNEILQKLEETQKMGYQDPERGKAEFDRIMASPEVQALRNQPINFN